MLPDKLTLTITPLDYFRTLVRDEARVPLLEAAIALGHITQPDLDVLEPLSRVDRLVDRFRRRMHSDAPVAHKLRQLLQYFFQELGFELDRNHYYAPENSYIHRVVERRRGIPVTLALVLCEIGHGAGIPLRGVSFPGHFLVKCRLPEGDVVIDPGDGRSLSRDDLEERLWPYRQAQGLTGELDVPLALFLQAAESQDILVRMLRNLQDIYRSEQAWEPLVQVCDRLLVVRPHSWEDWRDRGLAQAEAGQWARAIDDLKVYVKEVPQAADAPSMRDNISAMQRLLRLH